MNKEKRRQDEYTFQLIIKADKEIDPSDIRRKREIFRILTEAETSSEIRIILDRNARCLSELQRYTEEMYDASQYILAHYFKITSIIKGEVPPKQDVVSFHNRRRELHEIKKDIILEKVSIANRLLIKTLSEEMRDALIEQLALLSKVNSISTRLSLAYTYIEDNDSALQAEAKSRHWSNVYKET